MGAHGYAAEIRDYLLGRMERRRDVGAIRRGSHDELTPRWADWWIFEGRQYDGLAAPLAKSWSVVARQVERMRAVPTPRWRVIDAPEGEVDWLASAIVSVTSDARRYVARASGLGLAEEERRALEGWLAWIGRRWSTYIDDVGTPDGVEPGLPEALRVDASGASLPSDALRKWAHAARRSRWPLLRSVVAESLRIVLEPQELDRLPLPTVPDKLFELVCFVRVLRVLHPPDRRIRWLDLHDGANTLRLPGVVCEYQPHVADAELLACGLYPPELVHGLRRHAVPASGFLDAWFQFAPARGGFEALLIECKSGEQGYDAAVDQLHRYRAVRRNSTPGPVLAVAVVEREMPRADEELDQLRSDASRSVGSDVYAFCSASRIADLLAAVGIK